MADRPLLYLIDGHAVAYRQFFALPEAAFSTKAGEVTNAVYGFTRILIDILLDKKPKYLAVTFDAGLSGRDEIYEDYKATREKMPDSLDSQIKRIHDVLEAFNVPVLKLDGYEADDVIGTIAQQAEAEDVDVLVITGDRDLLQLLSDNVKVQLPAYGNKPDQVFDIPRFIEKYQIHPDQLVDLKALMGDSSDNIPGIRGIGEKTGTKLLLKYDTLDGVYEHIDEIKGSQHKKLVSGKDDAYLSQNLARIRRHLPVDLDLEACVAQDFDFAEVSSLFRDLEFRSLFDKLEQYNMNQLPLFNMNSEDVGFPSPADLFETRIVRDKNDLDELIETLNNSTGIIWDVETTGIDKMSEKLVGIALAVEEDVYDVDDDDNRSRGWYIPVGHDDGQQIAIEFVMDALEAPMTNMDIPKYAHNATYDLVFMQRYGVDVRPIMMDTMLAEWLSDPISKFLGLKNFARQYLGITMTDIEELIGSGKSQITMAQVAIDNAAKYATADAVVTMKAVRYLKKQLQAQDENEGTKNIDLMRDIEMPIVPVIADMEKRGIVLDVAFLKDFSDELNEKITAIEQKIYDLGGMGTFNINSPKQLNEILFDNLKLPVEGLNKTTHGYSTNATTLDALKSEHEIIECIIEYRELSKLKSTYVDALPELVNPMTGRVHTSYNQTGTTTGRFSSSNPNLQNIPIRTELGREVRRAFIAPENHYLLAVDYSQIELRVMAHISQDATLIAAFEEGQDIHRATAAAVYDIDPEEVTYEQRSFAKRVNFGLMYGMGSFRLARESELTLAEADEFIKRYFERLPGVERYISETKKFAHKHGYVETLLGRRRYFAALKGGAKSRSAAAEERAAINMPIQGTAADILKLAMINLYRELNANSTKAAMSLQVHDELVLEVPEDELQDIAQLVVETMENAYHLDVPIVANAEYGKNWRDMEAI